jgi:hypothetical protein
MLQWFRAYAARIAAITTLWMAVVGASTVVPHDDDSHDTYAAMAVDHDPSAHRVRPAQPTDEQHPLHCVVCHWVRSFRPHVEWRAAAPASADAGISLPLQRFSISATAPFAQPPLRSPPSAPAHS